MENYFPTMKVKIEIKGAADSELTKCLKPFTEYSFILAGADSIEIKETAKITTQDQGQELATCIYRNFDVIEISQNESASEKPFRRMNPYETEGGFVPLPQGRFILGETLFEIKERINTVIAYSQLSDSSIRGELNFGAEEFSINRDVLLAYTDNKISRKHAILKKIGDKYYIKDVYSTFGTFIPIAKTEGLGIDRFANLRLTSSITLTFTNQESMLMIDYEIKKLIDNAIENTAKDAIKSISIEPIMEESKCSLMQGNNYKKYKVMVEEFFNKNSAILKRDFGDLKGFINKLISNIPVNPMFIVDIKASSMELIVDKKFLEKVVIDAAYYNKNLLYYMRGLPLSRGTIVYFFCIDCGIEDSNFKYLACDVFYRMYKYLIGDKTRVLCTDINNSGTLFGDVAEEIQVSRKDGLSKDANEIISAIEHITSVSREEQDRITLYIVLPDNKMLIYEEADEFIKREEFNRANLIIKTITYDSNKLKHKTEIENHIRSIEDDIKKEYDEAKLIYGAMKFACFSDNGLKKEIDSCGTEFSFKESFTLLQIAKEYNEFRRTIFFALRESKDPRTIITLEKYRDSEQRARNWVYSKISTCETDYEENLVALIVKFPIVIYEVFNSNDFNPLKQILRDLVDRTRICINNWENLEDKLIFLFAAVICIHTSLSIVAMPPKDSGNLYIP